MSLSINILWVYTFNNIFNDIWVMCKSILYGDVIKDIIYPLTNIVNISKTSNTL